MNELREQAEEAAAESEKKPDLDAIRIPEEFLFKIFQKWLAFNASRNRGYILDGFPRTYKGAQELFLVKPVKEGDDEEAPPDEEEGEKSYEGFIPDESIFPSSAIYLSGEDAKLNERIKNLPEEKVEGTHYNALGMKRRLLDYRNYNDSKSGEPSVQDFFREQSVEVFSENALNNNKKSLESFKIFIERVSFTIIY
jgi:adenylate kinase